VATPSKYHLYEGSVQSPEAHIELLAQICSEVGRPASRRLREDFCGTGMLSCHWVSTHPENTALGLDLDPEPLAYGRKTHMRALRPGQRSRVSLVRENVMTVGPGRFDVVVAGNFSFFIFKKRGELLKYFKKVRGSLATGGVVVLEMAGGPGMTAALRETRRIAIPGVGKVLYTWHQRSFDPITHDARYSIHFRLPDGRRLNDAFEYDWRLWTIPEVRDALREAGFRDTVVYWEKEDRQGRGTGEYERADSGDNDHSWIAQVVGIR